jgi:hypothetical protein
MVGAGYDNPVQKKLEEMASQDKKKWVSSESFPSFNNRSFGVGISNPVEESDSVQARDD